MCSTKVNMCTRGGGDHQSTPAREKTMTYSPSSPGAGHQTSPFQRLSKIERTGREDEEVTEGRRDGEAGGGRWSRKRKKEQKGELKGRARAQRGEEGTQLRAYIIFLLHLSLRLK